MDSIEEDSKFWKEWQKTHSKDDKKLGVNKTGSDMYIYNMCRFIYMYNVFVTWSVYSKSSDSSRREITGWRIHNFALNGQRFLNILKYSGVRIQETKHTWCFIRKCRNSWKGFSLCWFAALDLSCGESAWMFGWRYKWK
jgi:hypothetical protein